MKFRVSIILFIICINTFSQGLGIPSRKWGIGFGNLSQFSGLRFNLIDKNTEEINGINIRLTPSWKEGESGGTINGISVGLLADLKKEGTGISVGLLGCGGEKLTGINFGGIALAGDSLRGINIGGVTWAKFTTGINVGGLLLISERKLSGINLGGVLVGADSIEGMSMAFFAVGGGTLKGLNVATVIGSGSNTGISFSAYHFIDDDLGNSTGSSETIDQAELSGISVSIFNRIKGRQKGVTIGLVNYAREIKGLQLGVFNYVKENPKGLRILPVFNTQFRRKKGT